MKKRLQICLLFLCFLFARNSFSTHIVGGVLTYVHNGGSSYTITAKLYRDCSSNLNSPFSASFVLTVLGNNGALFSPTKNISMIQDPTSVKKIPSGLDACAIPPNPMPCVEEAIYTATVNTLPLNVGGYHLFYQFAARNYSTKNISSTPAANIGESIYAFIPGTGITTNSNPTFKIFPPLFLCVNTPFTFDHSATDKDGDSLVYEFYTPYDGDLATGAASKDPTFVGNVAKFTSIVFLPGYTATQPLGSGPMSLNAKTGLMTGTPNTVGQFVVGVLVKEFRNGVFLGYTARDFQFNVINCPPPTTGALPTITSCNSNTVSFSTAGAATGTVLWDFGDNTTTTDTSTSKTPTYTYPGFGNYTVTLSSGIGGTCSSTSTGDVIIAPTAAEFTSNSPKCLGFSTSFTDKSTISSNATISSWTWDFGDGSTNNGQNPSHTYVNAGTYNVTLTITNSVGCTDTAVHTVIINAPPTPNAGADQSICGANSTITLSGSITNATGGTWTTTGTGSFSPNNTTLNATYSATAADIASGKIRFILTSPITNSCGIKRDTMFVSFSSGAATASAGADQTICGTTTATLAGNTPASGIGTWTKVSGTATITNPNSPTSTVTGLVAGTSCTLRWTISSAGGCASSFDDVIINVDLAPTLANAGVDQTLCGTTSATLAGNTAIVGTGKWSLISGTAIFSSTTIPNTSITGLTIGTTAVLRWTISKGVCSNFDEVAISVNKGAIVNAGADQLFCAPANITLNGSVSNGSTTGIWTTLGNGTFNPNASTLNATYILGSNDITNGKVTLVLTSTNNPTGCSAITDTMKVNFGGVNGVVSTTTTNVSCFAGNDGTATVSVLGGINPLSYFWNTSPSQTTATASTLKAGAYSVTITDGNGCTSKTNVTITEPQPLTVNATITNATCFGGTNGSLIATPSGGTSAYTYLWTPGNLTTATISNKVAGAYSLTVTDSKNCKVTASFTIAQPTKLSINLSSTVTSCFNGNDGTVSASVSGGTAPISYSWNPSGSTSPSVTGLVAGKYTLTVTDANTCVLTDTISVKQPLAIATTITGVNETCNNLDNGSAAVIASGGSPNYTYLWSPGNSTTSSISNLASGTYNLVVKDSKGCVKNDLITITEPSTLSANFINVTNVSCNGSDGSVTVNATGGTSAYIYLWTPGNLTTATISNLPANTYSVKVTDSKGCSVSNSVTITQPTSTLSAAVSSTAVSCFGGANGTVSVTPNGGNAPYLYKWTPGNSTNQTVSSLIAGNYIVTVTDANGCTVNNTVTVTSQPQLALTTSSVSATCNLPNGKAYVKIAGGVGPFQYLWTPSNGTKDSITSLASGLYSVKVTDGNGCTTTKTVNVNDIQGPTVTISTTTNPTCFGSGTGTATASVSNGTGPFNYLWSPSGGTGAVATGLKSGIYTVKVTDANNCQSLVTTTPPLTDPTEISITSTITDVKCHEGSDGTASVSVTGGVPSYTYLWSPLNQTTSTISGLGEGTYYVEVTDSKGCAGYDTIIIEEPPIHLIPTITASSNVSCTGGNNGSATVSAFGGTPNYSYNWSPSGGNGPSASGLTAGVYIVTITDKNNCSDTTSVKITEPIVALSASGIATPTTCFNGNDGSGSITAIGGTPKYSYLWSPFGGTVKTATGLSPGNYSITVTDSLGCKANASLTITAPSNLAVTIAGTNTSCGLSNGKLTAQINGGTAPYKFLWSNGSTKLNNLDSLSVGTYTVTITDAKNCSAISNSFTINNNSGLGVSIASSSNVSCFGGTNGTATANITGGQAPYSINWQPSGGSNLTTSGLSNGNYSVIITDNTGCTASASVVISQPTAIAISVSSTKDVSCFGGSDGNSTILASGGTPNYTYSWSPNSSTTASATNLSKGTYSVIVSDNNSCTNTVSINISEPAVLTSTITSTTNPLCFNGKGGASVIGNGGTLPYSYSWATTPIQLSSSASNLPLGNTIVTITDANNCKTNNTATITSPTQVKTLAGKNDTICIGSSGTVTATASGGAGTYTYNWTPGNISNNGTLTASPTVNTIYYVTATDKNGCIGSTDSTSIILNSVSTIADAGKDQTICGSTTTSLTGNSPAVGTGKWTLISGVATIANPNSPTSLITGLVAGSSYTFRWTISNKLCTSTSDDVVINVDNSPTIALAGTDQTLCAANTTTLSANTPTVGIGKWSLVFGVAAITNPSSESTTITGLMPGATAILRWTISKGVCSSFDDVSITGSQGSIVNAGPDQFYCTPSGIKLTGSISNGSTNGIWKTLGDGTFSPNTKDLNATYTFGSNDLSKGKVVLILSDTNNTGACSTVADTMQIKFIGFNGIVSTSSTDAKCFGSNNGTGTVSVVGGVSPFTYFWNSSPSQISQTATNLSPGKYIVKVTDGNGCSADSSVTISQPQPLAVSSNTSNASCLGSINGTVTAIPTGGTAPYNYLWTPGNLTTASISNQPAGNYSVLITDANNCTVTGSFVISQPSQFSVSLTSTKVSCANGNDGTITANVSGGKAPLQYSWSPSGTSSPTLSGLKAGKYTLTVTDANLCVITDTITVSELTKLSTNLIKTDETCNILNNGTAAVTVSGGTASYSYLWTPGNTTASSVSNLTSGSYTLTVTDSKGCSNKEFFTIAEPDTLKATFINLTNVSCATGNNGSLTVNVQGGNGSYAYIWTPGNATTAKITNIATNTYTVVATDAKGCTVSKSIAVNQPTPSVSVSLSSVATKCFGDKNGSVSATPIGGKAPFTYLWMPGNFTTQNVQNLGSGLYTVTIKDSLGCKSNDTISVTSPSQIAITMSSTNSACGLANGKASVFVAGGLGNYTYNWLPSGGTSHNATGLLAGNYSVTVTDNNNCSETNSVNVNNDLGPILTISTITNVTCFGASTGTATATVTSGTGPFTYIWLPSGGNSATATGLTKGTYTVQVVDNNGCKSLVTTTPPISEPTEISLIQSKSDVSCFGGNNGSAAISATGGSSVYSYLWTQTGSTNSAINNISKGQYTVEVKDSKGCIKKDTITINEPTKLSSAISGSGNVSCFGGKNGSATVNVFGGAPNYNYNWTPSGGNGPSASGLSAGTYSVTITDNNNCTTNSTVVITQPTPGISVTITSIPPSCSSSNDGSATAVVVGGSPSYSYLWSPTGGTSKSATGLSSGNYVVTITDSLGCKANASVTINSNLKIKVSLVGTNAACGKSNGSVTAQINGGTAPYTFVWSNGSTKKNTLDSISVGTYFLKIIDANNCVANSDTVTITNLSGLSVSITSSKNVRCFAGNDGSAVAKISGGTAPYKINWLPFGGNALTASSLTASTFTANVVDSLGCTATATVTLQEPTGIAINSNTVVDVSCFGGTNGSASVQVSGGNPSYSYTWSPKASNSSSISNLTAGTYSVIVVDGNNCSNSISVKISEPTKLSSSFTSTNQPKCFTDSGSATIIGSGGKLPYTYSWSTNPKQSGSTISNLKAGNTIITITDGNGCTATNNITITKPTAIVTIGSIDDTICAGSTTTLTASATGGVGTYTYNWLPTSVTNSDTLNVSPATATTFYVTAIDQNGCKGNTDSIRISINGSTTIASAGVDQTICGTSSATLNANIPVGGTGKWTFVSGTATITNPTSPTTTVTGLASGTNYTLRWTITSSSCSPAFDDVIISVDQLPTTTSAGNDQTLCGTTTATLAANTATVGSGMWTVVFGIATITNPASPTTTVTGLIAGTTAILRWTISKGVCSNFDEVSISVNKGAIVNAGQDQHFCSPININLNGSVSNGSTTGKWSTLGNGKFTPDSSSLNGTYVLGSNDITKGKVTLILTSTNNALGCSAVTDTLQISFGGSGAVSKITSKNTSCFGVSDGSATVNVTGGVGPFNYFWSTVPSQTTQTINNLKIGTYTVTTTDGNGCVSNTTTTITQPQQLSTVISSVNVACATGTSGSLSATTKGGIKPYKFSWNNGATSSSLSNLIAGTYNVTVTDSNNCQINQSITITEPKKLSVTFNKSNVSCFNGLDGTISANVSGGKLPYKYNWNPTNSNSSIISSLKAATYTLTVTDASNCTLIDTVSMSQPTDLVTSVSGKDVTCNNLNDGSALVTVNGGTPSYNYLWQPGNMTIANPSNLKSGAYTIVTTDSKGCSKTNFITIVEPKPLTASFINQKNVSCGLANGAVTINAQGGTPAYTYLWSFSNSVTSKISGLPLGNYSVKITDSKGCQYVDSVTIIEIAPPITSLLTSTPVLCFGDTNGTVTAKPIGGKAPFTYLWTPGNNKTQTVQKLIAGKYKVSIKDSLGCVFIDTISVGSPNKIIILTSSINATCSMPNGKAFVSATGGLGNYSYSWSPTGGNLDSAISLNSGVYTINVTDSNNCKSSKTVNISDISGPTVSVSSVSNVSCFGGNDGSATAIVTNGTGPFTYQWSPSGGNSATATGLKEGIYTVTVTDSNLCKSSLSTSPPITQPTEIILSLSNTDVSCNGGANGTASVSAIGGTGGYTYLWTSLNTTTPSVNNLSVGKFIVQVTDSNSCTKQDTVQIIEPLSLTTTIAKIKNVNCFGGNDGIATISVTGGTPFYNYSWLPSGGNGPTATNLDSGIYKVTITDDNGCTSSINLTITEPLIALSVSANGFPAKCFNVTDGSATVSPIGGTSPYSYLWMPTGGTAQNAIGLNAGTYTVLVNDSLDCKTNVSITVTEPPQLIVNIVGTDAKCSINNGFISAQVSGGTNPYNYFWSNGSKSKGLLDSLETGTFTLQVTDSNGCSANSVSSVTIKNIAGPVVSISSSNDVSCFGGNNGVAIANATGGTVPYKVHWTPFGGNNLVASTLTASTFKISVTDSIGCIAIDTIAISEPSAVSISVSSITNVSCDGGNNGSVSVLASGGVPNYSYQWSPISGSTQTVNGLVAGIYVVNVLDKNSCSESISVHVTEPTALSSKIISTINPICFNGVGSASVVGLGGTIPYKYSWATNPVQTTSNADSLFAGSIQVTITDSNGCSTTNTATVTQPLQVITSIAQFDTICIGSSSKLQASASGGGGTYIYQWQPSGVINTGGFTISPIKTSYFSVTATDQNGCVGTTDSLMAIVLDLRQSNLNLSGITPICPGKSTTIEAKTNGITGNLTYSWNNSLNSIAGPHTVSPKNPTTYKVTVTDICGTKISDSISIKFNPPPTVELTVDSAKVCVPDSVLFTDRSKSGNSSDPIVSWIWTFGDGFNSLLQNPSHTYTTNNTYLVGLTVTTAGGCTNSLSKPKTIITYPKPNAEFTVNLTELIIPKDKLICSNLSVGASTYLWDFDNGSSSSLVNPTFKYETLGDYNITLYAISEHGCKDTAVVKVEVNADLKFPNAFTPNPNGPIGGAYDLMSKGNDVFFPFTKGVKEYLLQVYNRWGELVFESTKLELGWDGYYKGKLCIQDVYIWKVEILYENGKSINQTGDVTLLR